MKIFIVAGARPNFMKIAPLLREIIKGSDNLCPIIIHTGQHYDYNMSDSFFIDLNIARPDYFLGIGSGTHAEQTAKIMIEFEKVLRKEQPEILLVVGDVNSTLACALVASKTVYTNTDNMNISFVRRYKRPVIVHVEAGLRSFDRTMPEEINRIITDSLSDMLFTSESIANDNLRQEGIGKEKIYYVGNVMIDALEMMKDKIEQCPIIDEIGLNNTDYGVLTMHRPSNVDNTGILKDIVQKLLEISERITLVFPVHPRTRKNLDETGLFKSLMAGNRILILDPLPYKDFMKLMFNSKFAITDSGGLQEETTYLGIPCLTLRPNTERPVTVSQGTNLLVNLDNLVGMVDQILNGKWKKGIIPEYWDGQTAQRIVSILHAQTGKL
ncbi:UDP-N-acetylglucosamine 2-epimerase (non-hydrolyzing) [candidate division WS5 bacterium]|uniref:UDP-N-acetylglucosamine 2-epimerase (Non-hydrolyzing) n=1 Tax=candidate division WS5 bacterium TaxID=2093353 RepID=A0A419DCV8_9BACT|nr:MAG: UDP-N-acetylglucosamine 2-epimerase (non-hydrolyzing) [candidate division WS5 bacterium]